jgi:Protein of unknown function (DUF3105)
LPRLIGEQLRGKAVGVFARGGLQRRLAGALALSACCLGCSDEIVPATQVVVTVNSDLEVGQELTSVTAYVLDAAGGNVVDEHPFELTADEPRTGQVRLPFSFVIAKKQASRFRLDVIGYGPTGPGGAERAVVEQKVIASFRDRETLLLKVFLSKLCVPNVCQGERTCHPESGDGVEAGECGEALRPSLDPVKAGEEDRAWTGEQPGGRDAGMDADVPQAGEGADAGGAGRGGTGGRGGMADGGAGRGAAGGRGGAGASSGTGGRGAGTGGMAAGTGGMGGAGNGGLPECATGERTHVDEGSDHAGSFAPEQYESDPPSSGMHCEPFGQYTTYTDAKPLPPCNFVHNLEHGAVVLLYNCEQPCPEIVDGLEGVIAAGVSDPNCNGSGILRVILTPYHDMDATFAATAWQRTWTSKCTTFTQADHDALVAFVTANLGTTANRAGEPGNCNNGSITPVP